MSHNQVNWKRNAILAGVLLIFFSAALWYENSYSPKKEKESSQSKHAFDIEGKEIRSIRIIDPKHQFQFDCQSGEQKLCKAGDHSLWSIRVPAKMRADDSNLRSFVNTLKNLKFANSIDLNEETVEKRQKLLKEYGLEKHLRNQRRFRRVEVQYADKTNETLFLGDTHPIGNNFFALRQRDSISETEATVYLIPSYFKSNIEKDISHWRNKDLFSIRSHEVEKFQFRGPKSKLEGFHRNGEWLLKDLKNSKRPEVAGDSENIDNLLSAALKLRATGFAADHKRSSQAKEKLRRTKKAITLKIFPKKSDSADRKLKKVEMVIFEKLINKKLKLYAMVSNLDPLFELPSGGKNRLNKGIKDLRRTKLLTSKERFAIQKIQLSGPKIGPAELTFEKKESEWTTSPVPRELDQQKIQKTLDRLSSGKIKDFVTQVSILRSADSAKEKIRLRLSSKEKDQNSSRYLQFWKTKGKVYARDLTSKRNEAFLMDKTIADALPWSGDFYDRRSKSTTQKPQASSRK